MLGSLDKDVTPCVAGQRKKRFASRWSLRHLIYSSPILNRRRSQNTTEPAKSHKKEGRDISDGKVGTSSKESERHHVQIHQATSRTSVYTTSTKSGDAAPTSLECPLCFAELTPEDFCELEGCGHRACICCFQQYLRVEITESRICISCPECLEPMHPNEIRSILNNPALFSKYEDFMVRRVLAVDPDARWCPAPDCSFAVIASECASCPKLRCERPGCDSFFCYHCKAEWHPNQTCDAARALRSPHIRASSVSYSQDSQHRDDIKPCPRCQVLIVKMDDGSCNHMMCAVCGAEFCWLCMKEINDLHFLSPSGCTFWGKKPWSRKKKILWQLGTLVGAPVGIALVASITIPAMVIGIPVWVGRKLYARYKTSGKHKRNTAIIGGVIASVLISPILAGLAVGIGVPILLFYVYGVVPLSLCRSGGCGGGGSASGAAASDDDEGGGGEGGARPGDSASIDAASAKGGGSGGSGDAMNPSIGEASLSMASGSQVLSDQFGHPTLRDHDDAESASTAALAGSLGQGHAGGPVGGSAGGRGGQQRLEIQADLASAQRFSLSSLSESANASSIADDAAASVRALAGSMLNYKTPGSDSCSCVTTEDCTSERVRFDDATAAGLGTSALADKTSIGSSCSFRARCVPVSRAPPLSRQDRAAADTLSDDSVCIDIEDRPSLRKYSSQAAILRSQFFHSIDDGEPIAKSLNEDIVIEVSNETLDKSIQPLVRLEH